MLSVDREKAVKRLTDLKQPCEKKQTNQVKINNLSKLILFLVKRNLFEMTQ